MDQYSRSNNILIHGVPYPSDGSQETHISGVDVTTLNSNIMGINLSGADIRIAHRIGRPNTAAPGQSSKPQPIVVRFVRRAMRNRLLWLVITEQLTQSPRSQLLKNSNDLVAVKKLESAWSHNGRILVKTLTVRITSVDILTDLIQYN